MTRPEWHFWSQNKGAEILQICLWLILPFPKLKRDLGGTSWQCQNEVRQFLAWLSEWLPIRPSMTFLRILSFFLLSLFCSSRWPSLDQNPPVLKKFMRSASEWLNLPLHILSKNWQRKTDWLKKQDGQLSRFYMMRRNKLLTSSLSTCPTAAELKIIR